MSTKTIRLAQGRSRFTVCQATSLPVKRDITLAYMVSLAIALIMAIASVVGILYAQDLYSTSDQIQLSVVDALNLVVGLPALLGSMWLAQRGRLLGLLCWPGALLYVVYRYLASAKWVKASALSSAHSFKKSPTGLRSANLRSVTCARRTGFRLKAAGWAPFDTTSSLFIQDHWSHI